MNQRIEHLILSHLIHNEPFSRKVSPYIRQEYFDDNSEKLIFKQVQDYIVKHNSLPTKQSLLIDLDQQEGLHENEYQKATEIIKSEGKASTSFLQRKLQIGYNRAARIIDMMEADGIVSKANHVGKRDVL